MTSSTNPESYIKEIWNAEELGTVTSVKPLGAGTVNAAFLVNDVAVVRFNTRDSEDQKFKREVESYRLLRETDIPAPEVLAYSLTKEAAPWHYIVLSKLPGRTVSTDWPNLSESEQAMVSHNAGKLLALSHNSITLNHFGDHLPESDNSFLTWMEYLQWYIQYHWALCSELGIYNEAILDRLYRLLEDNRELIESVTQSTLIHGDYQQSNLLHTNGEITGVFDYEWSLVGDPEMDFRDIGSLEVLCPGSRDYFFEGYQSVRQFSQDFDKKQKIYKTTYLLQLSHTGKKYLSEDIFLRIQKAFLDFLS